MSALRLYSFCFLFLFFSVAETKATSCKAIHEFEGLIFDGGSFPAPKGMEGRLDFALSLGVAKVVLFSDPANPSEDTPQSLENIFPDLVVQGSAPWSGAAGVEWLNLTSAQEMVSLEEGIKLQPDRKFLLAHISRFDHQVLTRLVQTYQNLWLGLNDDDVSFLLKTCGQGSLGDVLKQARGRIVYSSIGLQDGWKYYKWYIARLKELARLLPVEQADGLVFRNAETLYDLSVNAP